MAVASSSPMFGALLILVLSSAAGVHGASSSGAAPSTPLDQLCGSLGSFYVTPELCASALCLDASSSCRSARGAPELAALATRLVAANATAAKASIESALALHAERVPAPASAADADARKGMRSCLQLYAGAVPALRWAARSVAAGRYSGAREVLEAAQYVASGCAGMAGEATLPKENDRFSSMAIVAHAVVASMSTT
ncbi:uncharacterized protein LOC123395459 [Hordeum vulgare subsp. vulgare]|uniref:Predicted protein n=1 Tax=Hordeum vulgare subsp. vulgare TaxID=112509 RepID=F2CPP9_HORVV|nr:uncharacterized protein LOC123395459 [Hordeum vulgare subsp. vulgare]BAJ84820.1 predicted protein [Hordeum vulgare subsp. vulgare]